MYCGTHVVPSDFGVGLKIVGGVNCERCRNMHAMVTSVLPGTECAHTVREGKSWEREGGGGGGGGGGLGILGSAANLSLHATRDRIHYMCSI